MIIRHLAALFLLVCCSCCIRLYADEHPLVPCLKLAREGIARIERDVQDYTCTLVKRERIAGKLVGPELISAKVRHKQSRIGEPGIPFAVYMKFLKPSSVEGREVLFVRQTGESKLLVRKGGKHLAFLTVSLDPTSSMAMMGNRYPITEFGIKRLVQRMIDFCNRDLAYDECEVNIRANVSVDDHEHPCTCVEVIHPVKREYFQYHIAKIYIDEKLNLPVRFESYDWPKEGSDQPVLQEQYVYLDLQVNVGLSDQEFDPRHEGYKFR